jgi:hypothetical protein
MKHRARITYSVVIEIEVPAGSTDVLSWKATGAYLGQSDNKNRHRERIWFSPGCLVSQGRLFEP